jgi:hypothetical protein
MQSKQSHAPVTPSHVDDPCDDWVHVNTAAQRVIDDYATTQHDVHQEREYDDALFARSFTTFAGFKS